jgi:hypothetical protein
MSKRRSGLFDDPLFLSLASPTVVVDEDVEERWQYVVLLVEWMQWDKKCVHIMLEDEPLITPQQTIRDRLASFDEYPIPPPSHVVHLGDLGTLPSILSLPVGWQAYTIVDDEISLVDRITHYQASLDYLRANIEYPASLLGKLDDGVLKLYNQAEDPLVRNKFEYKGSLLVPFVRNTWLVKLDELLRVDEIVYSKDEVLSVPAILALFDWEAVSVMIEPYKAVVETSYTSLLARYMTGEKVMVREATIASCVPLQRTIVGIEATNKSDSKYVGMIYTKLLATLPLNVEIDRMGLEPLVGGKSISALSLVRKLQNKTGVSNVTLDKLVGWINACIITYITWYNDDKWRRGVPDKLDGDMIVDAGDEELLEIVELLGESVGLAALRRILLSLLYYIEKNGEVDRANIFAEMIEAYLAKYDGEEEGVRTLELSKTSVIQQYKL